MTKKLIDRLEELADEMKVIVHQLRVPSTIDVGVDYGTQPDETVITFEGQQYKKVDRKARDGDVVVFENENIHYRKNKPYLVLEDNKFTDEDGDLVSVYNAHNRIPETVDVYELMDGYNPQITILEESNVKSPNQQRAEVIAKAKEFVEKNEDGFKIVVKERAVNCIRAELDEKDCWKVWIGKSKCMPTDVYNEHIGKAIALGRVLNLDVSEFENAVQPTELAEGQNIKWDENDSVFTFERFSNRGVEVGPAGFFARKTYDNGHLKIINDTNAEY